VLVVDDHEVLAASLAFVLDSEPDLKVVGVASSAAIGAAGFIDKTRSLAEVVSAVRSAAAGESRQPSTAGPPAPAPAPTGDRCGQRPHRA